MESQRRLREGMPNMSSAATASPPPPMPQRPFPAGCAIAVIAVAGQDGGSVASRGKRKSGWIQAAGWQIDCTARRPGKGARQSTVPE